ncbi:MAG TPA: ribosome biogenesis GTP-binding protein YihA/YsxC [Bryobacteraceae bacterium]|jgi:GTP-binding protein|nr:ribosome biogenesis GTP-binding protein YihA/YsxC [Bryobacteraceae bacterium]
MAAQFIISAARPEQFPPESDVEVAFLGRSNVGKSSLLNKLVGTDGLARTSARPGCTQYVNFFQVDGGFRFVDLPGYGFAKVPREITSQWRALIESYLLDREALRLCVIILDARRGWMEKDVELRDWLDAHQRPFVVAATKIDKLKSQKERHQSLRALRNGYSGEILECSAETGRGVREIWQAISKIKTPQ